MVQHANTPHAIPRCCALVLGAVLLVTMSACGRVGSSSSGQSGSNSNGQVYTCANAPCPPPIEWTLTQPNQTFALGAAGVFALKQMDINPKQFRFYYVFKAQQPKITLRMAASAYQATSPSEITPLATADQVLGQIGSYIIGVAHIARRSHAGQIIQLQITPITATGSAETTWRLAPIKQLIAEAHADSAWSGVAPAKDPLPEAVWSGELEAQLVSYVKVIIPGQPVAKRTYVFLRSDDPVIVKLITKAQYLAIAGPDNFTP